MLKYHNFLKGPNFSLKCIAIFSYFPKLFPILGKTNFKLIQAQFPKTKYGFIGMISNGDSMWLEIILLIGSDKIKSGFIRSIQLDPLSIILSPKQRQTRMRYWRGENRGGLLAKEK